MSELLVRPSTAGDLGEIQRIYEHWVLHSSASFEIDPPGEAEMARRREEILRLGLPYLTAEQGGAVVGYAYASAYRPRRAYRFTLEDSIYVDAERTGRGCGRALLAALIAECERGPWRQMIAVIGDGGNAASIGLHERLGFRTVGTLVAVGRKFGRWVDTVLMQRELGENTGELMAGLKAEARSAAGR
jgi:phosphinothricin acetyltransferase